MRFRKPAILASLSTLVAVGFMGIAQLLEMDDPADRLLGRALAPIAGSTWANAPARADDIAVVLIDDEALERSRQAWPTTYRFHARIARALAEQQPRAVFFDIAFTQARDDPSLELLVRELCQLRQSGSEVLLAGLRNAEGAVVIRPELSQPTIPDPSAPGGPRVPCVQVVAIEYAPDAVDQMAWSYPLKIADEQGGHPTAALAMAKASFGASFADPGPEPIALTWPRSMAREGVGWVQGEGVAPPQPYCRREWSALELVLGPLPGIVDTLEGWPDGTASKPLCVPYETVRAASLLDGAEAASVLRGRLVLVGTDTRFAPDRVQSPLHHAIPGVYLHAAALDNLLSYPGTPRREAGDMDGAHRLLWFLLSTLLVFVVAFVVRLVSELAEPWRLRFVGVAPPLPATAWRARIGPALRMLLMLLLGKLVHYLALTLLVVGVVVFVMGLASVSLQVAIAITQIAALTDLLELPEKLHEWLFGKDDGEVRQRQPS